CVARSRRAVATGCTRGPGPCTPERIVRFLNHSRCIAWSIQSPRAPTSAHTWSALASAHGVLERLARPEQSRHRPRTIGRLAAVRQGTVRGRVVTRDQVTPATIAGELTQRARVERTMREVSADQREVYLQPAQVEVW